MNIILVTILGLVVGSFLNAVIYRLHVKVSFMRGRSYCPSCKHDLSAKDLVPLFSFLFLRGKCRYCSKKISWQYPLVEFFIMVSFLILYWQFGLSLDFFVYLIYTGFLAVIFVYDLKYYLILDKVSIPAIVVAFLLSFFVLEIGIVSLLISVLIGGGFFLLQFVISKGKWIGGGDIRLGVLMGLMLGYPVILVALFIAYILGSVIGVVLIAGKKKKWKSQVPFGTFLSIATYIAFIFGEYIVNYYQDLFLL
ncbi:MAG: prepilin peptidase [Candidatus Kerfeldbacteria bacterium]|jgi:leader peptidase (prepilin peptidase) / N-methyltransferase